LKKLFFILTLFALLFAKDINPFLKIDVGAIAKDIALVEDNALIIGTTASLAKVYDYQAQKFIKTITIPKIKDFMGDTINASVSSVDYCDGRYLLLSDSGIGGYSDLRIFENNQSQDIFSENDKFAIVKAKFVTKDTILLGFLSNEVALYDIAQKKLIYKKQLSQSKFSNFALNKAKNLAAFSCESGVITVLEPQTGKIIATLDGVNVDNVFDVAIESGYVSTAGKDRRAGWYEIKSKKGDYIQAKFFVYATALSPDASLAAYAMDENNDISIYNLFMKSLKYKLKGQGSTLNRIIFKDMNTLFSASNDNIVIMWKLNK
jgi:hypothetical protein